MRKINIILLGSIPKGDAIRKTWKDWKIQYIDKISAEFPNTTFIHGDEISDSEGVKAVAGHDLYLLKHADVAIVDATAKKLGVGTSQEMVLAKYFGIPVITVIPRDSEHRKSKVSYHGKIVNDWVNPFIVISSDAIVETIDEAVARLRQFIANPGSVKDISIFTNSIDDFQKNYPEMINGYRKKLEISKYNNKKRDKGNR